jgi:PAS domain S-box-containing protein
LAEQKALFSIVHDITARKQADKELRESLSRFDELIAKVSVGVYIVWLLADGRKKFEYVSDRWCSIHKIRREEVIADAATVDEQVHPDEAVAFFERHLEAARDQKPFLWEGRFAIGDGEFRWMRIESNPTVFGNGDIRFFGVTQDITERKRAEGALKESEEKFRTLFNLIPDAALLADAETGQIVKANKASEDLFEIPLDNLTGMNHTELYSEELRKKADVEFKKGPELLSKPFPPLEMIVETPSGIKKTVELRGSALYIDNKLHLLGTFRDITERKKVDKVLTRKATLLEEAQDLAKLGSWEWDIGNDKWYFSDQWKKIHGLSDNDLTTSKLIEIAHPEDAPYIEKAFSEAKEEGKPYNIQHRIIRADNNEIRYIHALGKIEYSQDTGDPVRMVGIAQDITEKTKVENNLREALKEKEFFMKELNHRVKNNLLMVSSLINLKDPETEADFSDIKHQIDAISLIHEKLYQTESVTEISCRDYFGDLLSSIFSSFTTRQIKIKADIDSVSIPTKSAVSLGLIINEIATNAIKYGFTDREEAVFSVTMKEDKENSRYELTLSNTGNPFPENVEVDNPQTLGLRLISALTEQLGGTMDLKRAPHPVFTFRFPVEEE